MFPVLWEFGPVTLYTYGAMLAVAFLMSSSLAAATARRFPGVLGAIPADRIMSLCAVSALGGIVGARLLFVAEHWDVYRLTPEEIPAIWHGGLIWYGGFAGGLLAALGYLRWHRLPLLASCDQLIPFVALGHAIGRVGCLLNGCCYGQATTAWCGLEFPGFEHRLIPTQAFEAVGLLVLYFGLRQLQRPNLLARPGTVVGSYLVGYAALRFLLEFWRADQPFFGGTGFTQQQMLSLLLALLGLALLFWGRFYFRSARPRGKKRTVPL